MDVVLSYADEYVLTPYVYPSALPEDNIMRQFISLNLISMAGGAAVYLITASLAYVFLFDKALLKHPQIIENQIKKEIQYTFGAIPGLGILTATVFLFEVRGYSKLYDNIHDSPYGWWAIASTLVAFILFTDCLIYWIHRFLHHKYVYKFVHKDHHRWKVPTPYASHAFHPLDGFLQSCPYHIYVFLFPMHKFTYLIMYVLVNIWTVSIHDGYFVVPTLLRPIINGSAHHTDHHMFYNYNYGQYLTLWDRIGNSFRSPSSWDGSGPLDEVKKRAQNGTSNGRALNGKKSQ